MEEAIIAKLLADAGVSALVGTRVRPMSLPQGEPLPAITVRRIDGGPTYCDDGESGLATGRVQIDTWGTTYADAKGAARAVTDSLSAFVGTVSGVSFRNVLVDDEQDYRESGASQAEYRYRTRVDFIVWWKT